MEPFNGKIGKIATDRRRALDFMLVTSASSPRRDDKQIG